MTARRFHSVNETAETFGMNPVTLYRAIGAGEFPAVRIRGRLYIPAQVIDDMTDAAMGQNKVVDTADWAARNRPA